MTVQTLEETAPSPAAAAVRLRPWSVLASEPFRKLWVATTLSLFGDFFSYIAMAWLVLQLTGSSLALGTVLVVQALPRAVLMVVGGALADRLSARLTMLGSMGLRAVFVAPLALLVLTGRVQMWEVYAIAVVFGIVDAFFMPARSSILPQVVGDRELEPGNAVLNVTAQASVILGPILGGVIVAVLGIGWAFGADALCFVTGLLFILWLPSATSTATAKRRSNGGFGGQIVAGFRYAWSDVGIRALLIVIAVVDFAANGARRRDSDPRPRALRRRGGGPGRPVRSVGRGRDRGRARSGHPASAPTHGLADRVALCVAGNGDVRGRTPTFAGTGRSGDGTVRHRHWRREHVRCQLASAPHGPGDAGTRHVTGHARVDGPDTDRVRGIWRPRPAQPHAALRHCRRDDAGVRGRCGRQPAGPTADLVGPYLMPAAASPAACAAEASMPASSARTAAPAKACERCWSMLRSMFASANQAQYVCRA